MSLRPALLRAVNAIDQRRGRVIRADGADAQQGFPLFSRFEAGPNALSLSVRFRPRIEKSLLFWTRLIATVMRALASRTMRPDRS
jgi:hypothetical protein